LTWKNILTLKFKLWVTHLANLYRICTSLKCTEVSYLSVAESFTFTQQPLEESYKG